MYRDGAREFTLREIISVKGATPLHCVAELRTVRYSDTGVRMVVFG